MRRTIAHRVAHVAVIIALTCVPLAFHDRASMPGYLALGVLAAAVAGLAHLVGK
ncbi:hypothetical protein ACTVZO_44100 [Streptomyces sp. IBSNAI002]|uniref:hypothetical protein n=1 Tax=Streptomyces sp. IBSNAI002 TaxID=3457500 RepID=UPI003FD2EBC8